MAKITLKDYLTSSGRFPSRAKSDELTDELKDNAKKLIEKVNAMLIELEIDSVSITSGFRPSDVNAATKNASTRSSHMTCEAMDILDDKDQSIAKKVTKEILEKHDLYREDYSYTKGKNTNWCHVQTRKTRSGKRIFKP